MARRKEVIRQVRLQIMAGKATPAPPIGPALGQHGINIGEFCKRFNDRTSKMEEMKIPVIINVYKDKSFDFILKTPPASELIKKRLGIDKGSGEPNKKKVGKLTREQLEDIAKLKLKDLNASSLESAVKIIGGTARSMGVQIEGR
jgi:large subunit ribosomal protein L11